MGNNNNTGANGNPSNGVNSLGSNKFDGSNQYTLIFLAKISRGLLFIAFGLCISVGCCLGLLRAYPKSGNAYSYSLDKALNSIFLTIIKKNGAKENDVIP